MKETEFRSVDSLTSLFLSCNPATENVEYLVRREHNCKELSRKCFQINPRQNVGRPRE